MNKFDGWYDNYEDEFKREVDRPVLRDAFKAGMLEAADIVEEYDVKGCCEDAWKEIHKEIAIP